MSISRGLNRDIRGIDNSWALTHISVLARLFAHTNYYPVRLYRMNETELRPIMGTPTCTTRISSLQHEISRERTLLLQYYRSRSKVINF